jgi:hypothetical protein
MFRSNDRHIPTLPFKRCFQKFRDGVVFSKSDKSKHLMLPLLQYSNELSGSINSNSSDRFIQVFATLLFMIGILLIGIAELNTKGAYPVGHVIQAVLIALLSKRPTKSRTLNSVQWEVYESTTPRSLKRRRDALLCTCEHTARDIEWLKLCNLADEESLKFVKAHLDPSSGFLPS